jgi:hypothetical protein
LLAAFIIPAPSSSMNASRHLLRTIQHTHKRKEDIHAPHALVMNVENKRWPLQIDLEPKHSSVFTLNLST